MWKEPVVAWFKLLSRIVIEIKQLHYFRTAYFTKTWRRTYAWAGSTVFYFTAAKDRLTQ